MRRCAAIAVSTLAVACGAQPAEEAGALPVLADYRQRDLRDEVVYQVLVDRFDDAVPEPPELEVQKIPGDLARIQGGDWQGLRRRLPYIRGLGVTALWLSPIFENTARGDSEDGYHGYWASDFTRLNPYFGTLADLQALVDDAHELGLRVFLDVAPNHTGPVFFYDLDGDGQRSPGELEPPFRRAGDAYDAVAWDYQRPALFSGHAAPGDGVTEPSPALTRFDLDTQYFHRRGRTENFTVSEQVTHGDFPNGLRDLATERPELVSAFVDTFAEWIRLTDVDGFRLDAVPHASVEFWNALCDGVRTRAAELGKHDFFMFGEVFNPDPAALAGYTASGAIDSVLDYSFKFDVIQRYVLMGGPAADAQAALSTHRSHYSTSAWQKRLSFADNHDTGRMLGALNDPYVAEIALTLVFTVDAIPTVYYGTEQGFSGPGWHEAREPMWWSDYALDVPLARHMRRLAELRAQLPALRYGGLTVRYASSAGGDSDALDAGLLAFERNHEEQTVLVAVNAHATLPASARMPTSFAPGTQLSDALGSGAAVVSADGSVELSVPPRQALLLGVGLE
jgi:alpha-amylase